MRQYLGFCNYIFSAEAVRVFSEFYGYADLISISGSGDCGFVRKRVITIGFESFSPGHDFVTWRFAINLARSN